VPTPEELMRSDLFARFGAMPVGDSISRVYDVANPVGRAMANLHGRLNGLFDFMNEKAQVNHHYNADPSRELLDLITEIRSIQDGLKRIGITLQLRDDYQGVLDHVSSFLTRSGGSPIPDDFTGIVVVEYEPVFTSSETEIELTERRQRVQPKIIGEGAFANVFSYADPEYGKKFAIKRAKSGLDVKELQRFRQEFEILHALNFPYVLEVYRYNDDRNDYTMEFCDSTVEVYIATRNPNLLFGPRRRIALQFLYGLNYLHRKGILHRDISLRNILVKVHDEGAATVKLSDFGLAKDVDSQMTQTDSEMRGSIIDPALQSFKAYAVINEIYPIGHILSFIFSGRKNLDATTGAVRAIVNRCVTHDLAARYQDVRTIIHDVEGLESGATSATQGAPA
jgi:tRNA A-37 threonylcarbamoyl transferase component Bud32